MFPDSFRFGNTMRVQRRTFIAGTLGASVAAWANAATSGATGTPLRIGLTPVFLDERSGFLGRFRAYFESALQQPVMFVQRRSYADVIEQLLNGNLSMAWLCGYPFVRYAAQMQLVAVPVYQGSPTYRSYIIAGAGITEPQRFADLRGRTFAYSDPLSNSGYLFAQSQLAALGQRDATFFRKSFFAFGHQNVIAAVSQGLADAGSVDGYVWDSLAALSPASTQKTRIVIKSDEFGFPPFVSLKSLHPQVKLRLRAALVGMKDSAGGRQLLQELRLDGFVPGEPALFDSIAAMMRRVGV